MAYLLPAFILFDTARACIAFGVIRYGVYLPPAKIAFLSESCKLTCALAFHFRWHRANTRIPNASIPSSWFSSLLPRSTSTGQVDYQICFYTAVPALLYLINNVFYLVGLRFVSPALLNTAMLAKLPLTAVLHYLIMKRARCSSAWISLAVLSTSVLSLHMPWDSIGEALWPSMASAPVAAAATTEGAGTFMVWFGPLLGFVIAAISSVTAIATEILLKKPMPFWSLQVWLYGWGALFAAFMVMAGVDRPASESHNPSAQIDENMGYMAVVLTTCATGLVVANILRKSDNLVKLVGSSATIVTTLLLQPLLDPGLWSETCNPTTVLAVGMIAMSTWTYNYYKEQPVQSSGFIELPLHSPKEKIPASPDVSMESLHLNVDRINVYHDDDEDDIRPAQKQATPATSDWLTPTRSKLINSGLIVLLLATFTSVFAKPEDMRRRLSRYDPLANVQFASWDQKPEDLNCVMNWQKEAIITVQSGRFSEWDRRYLQQTKCPIYPIPQGGYLFHMLWLGSLDTKLSDSVALTMDAWLATQRLQDGHQLIFWYDELPSILVDRYSKYADFVQFRPFDAAGEAAGTCLANMREYTDETYRSEVEMGPQTKSDLVRVLLLEKYGGVWLDTDSIPMRDFTPLLRMGSFSPALYTYMWNNNVIFFGPPKSAVSSAVLQTACSIPYDESSFNAKFPDVKPVHWYWLYNDGLMQVCDKHTNCGVQRLPIGLFDAEVEIWNRPGQTSIHAVATEADGHDLLVGQALPIAFRETFVWHARVNQHPSSLNPAVGTAVRAIRHRIDDLLQMGPSYEGQDLFAGPALIE